MARHEPVQPELRAGGVGLDGEGREVLLDRRQRRSKRLGMTYNPWVLACRERLAQIAFGLDPQRQRLFGQTDLRLDSRSWIELVGAPKLLEGFGVPVIAAELDPLLDHFDGARLSARALRDEGDGDGESAGSGSHVIRRTAAVSSLNRNGRRAVAWSA